MGNKDEFAFMDATAQAELVRGKQVKPLELVDAAIARIERLNPKLNAVVTPMFDRARDEASGKLPDGPFTGVPFVVKDLVAEVGGVRQADSTMFSGEYIAERDTEIITRFKRAGLVIVGKTNTPELGILPTTEPRRWGPCRNPWDLNRSTGGSSGGTAAAVASGMVPAGHGNDGGGSIRIPSSCCGLFGLKPTRGRNSLAPYYGDFMTGLVCEHALTRSVRDSAALLDATAGPAPGEPYYAPPPPWPFLSEVGANPNKLRIGVMTAAATGAPVHADCVLAVKETAALCQELGHDIDEVKLEVNGDLVTQAFVTVWFSSFAWEVDNWARRLGKTPTPDLFEPLTWAIQQAGRGFKATDYVFAVQNLQRISRDIAEQTLKFDVILTPVLAEPPVPLGSFDGTPEAPMLGFMRAATYAPFTPICNITGQPAMSVPLYWNKDGLPIGSHFIGHYAQESLLIRLASQLEKAKPWADKKPPTSA